MGQIVRLQVQIANLKVGSGGAQRYDNQPVQSLQLLEIDSGGVWGIDDSGERLADIHHRDHPQTKLREMINPISFGFTSHYEAMRSEFGDHLADGTAGENILIDIDATIRLSDVINGIWIERENGALAHLDGVSIAAPCAPFSRWALQFPDGERPDVRVTKALQFLNDGMRGFYCRFSGPATQVGIGDQVLVSI